MQCRLFPDDKFLAARPVIVDCLTYVVNDWGNAAGSSVQQQRPVPLQLVQEQQGFQCCRWLQVMKGELTQQQVSAVVNPTGGQLQAWGGVSSHISRAAGPSFAQDCKDVLASLAGGRTSVPEGSSVVMACSGDGPWQHVIHAVVPYYTGKRALWPVGIALQSMRIFVMAVPACLPVCLLVCLLLHVRLALYTVTATFQDSALHMGCACATS